MPRVDKLLRKRRAWAEHHPEPPVWRTLPYRAPDSSKTSPQRGNLCTTESHAPSEPANPFRRKLFCAGSGNGKCGDYLWTAKFSRKLSRYNNESHINRDSEL